MTRIAYIVSEHKLPGQLERLVRRLAAAGVSFVVHVDRKTRWDVYDEIVARTRDLDVVFLPRHVSHWGGLGHVRRHFDGDCHLITESVRWTPRSSICWTPHIERA